MLFDGGISMNQRNKKNKKDKKENVKILGPEDLMHLDVESVVDIVNQKIKGNKKEVKKIKPEGFEHYYTENPTSEMRSKKLKLKLKNDHEYIFKSVTGVYGKKKIDKATRLLIENAEIYGENILDIGCGYGPIGITLKKENPNLKMYMSDINNRACDYAGVNAKDNNADIEIRQGYLYEPWEDMMFDTIISNPPIVAGKKVWQSLIEGSYKHLNKDGVLLLVAYHNKGGKRIQEYMENIFKNVDTLQKSGGIRVYKSIKEE
ncbi:MAG: rRNA (guanine1207-N2)-methyltransferase [Oceanotoga sp.]|jgi:16S rRNA G1207 methylase RsmC|nr:rRNA (guanine1207-N2)-methyltransferase [Oceanotoga sp.]